MEEELLNKQEQENTPKNPPEDPPMENQISEVPVPSPTPPSSPELSEVPVPQPKAQEKPVLKEEPALEKKPSKFKLGLGSLAPIGKFLLNFIVPLICLVLSGGLIIAVLVPSYRELPLLEADLDQKRVLSSQLETKVAALTELVDFASIVKENSDLIDATLVSEPKIPELLFQVDQMSRESGMSISQLSYSGSEAPPIPSEVASDEVSEVPEAVGAGRGDIAVALSTSGSFWDLVAFLKSAENASRIIMIEDFRYSVGDASAEGGTAEGGSEISTTFRLLSPYLSVNSTATTDEPIELSISGAEFQAGMKRIKDLKHYDITVPEDFVLDVVVPAAEAAAAGGGELVEETSPAEVPEGPVTPPDASEVPAEGPPADLTVTPETESGTESPL